MFAFFIFLFVVVVIYFFTATPEQKDAFADLVIPTDKIPPVAQSPPAKEPSPSAALPGHLPTAPYQQLAETSPLPYQDTTMIKANRQQLVSLLELLESFLAFEAQEIAERSDPSIQLPLQTARSDFHTLQSEVEVLNRNPGIQSTITLSHLNEITSNLAYLQREVRLTGTAGSLQGPIDEFEASLKEGFTNPPAATPATKQEIKDFLTRLQAEITRLSASGTTDPIVRARVTALTQLKSDLQEVVTKLDAGTMTAADVPVKKRDLERALPVLGRPGEPLPGLLRHTGLPRGLANLLPSSMQRDPATLRKISELVDKYADTIVNGVSATFQVSYTSPREAEAGRKAKSSVDKTGFPSVADLDNVSNLKFVPATVAGGRPVTDRLAALPSDAGRGPVPARFDWKERAKAIEDQVKKRGLKPNDFGIMPSNTKVSADFSWRGYAKMICTRLQATMDPGLPETCGCPPMDWKGWRMNQSTK